MTLEPDFKPQIIVYRPHGRATLVPCVAYDEDGKVITWGVFKDQFDFRRSMGSGHYYPGDKGFTDVYKKRYPQGYTVKEVIGNWRTDISMKRWALT